jgi:hypothetical protein
MEAIETNWSGREDLNLRPPLVPKTGFGSRAECFQSLAVVLQPQLAHYDSLAQHKGFSRVQLQISNANGYMEGIVVFGAQRGRSRVRCVIVKMTAEYYRFS